jgi:PAS domain S-box-containing protein
MILDVSSVASELEALRDRLRVDADPAAVELVEAMQATIEQPRVAEDELSTQNDELEALQSALAEDAVRYRALFDVAPVAYVITDRFCLIREANATTAQLLDMDARFVVGKPLAMYAEGRERRELRAMALRLAAVSGGATESRSIRLRRRSGVAFDALVTASAHGDSIQWILQT